MVVHICNLSYSGGRGRKVGSWRPVQQREGETLSQKQNANKRDGVWLKKASMRPWVQFPQKKRKEKKKKVYHLGSSFLQKPCWNFD
jgi:hypothetical protein